MKTRVELASRSDDRRRVRELARVFEELAVRRDDLDPELVGPLLPGWLLTAFTPPKSDEEAAAWLERWRVAEDRAAFERASGWELADWLYWFSADNDLWSLVGTDVTEDGLTLAVFLAHDDDPVPVGALRWLADVAELEYVRELRVE